ncbi:MAG: D-alanyl-D-alanine carboxypeptidase family protein [Weeksellaceae bacterium]
MKNRFIILFLFFSLLFLFYPGDSPFYQIIAYERETFLQNNAAPSLNIRPIPTTKGQVSPELTALGVYVVELDTFTPVFERNANLQLYPASTTKVITSLVTRELYKPEDVISVQVATAEGQLMGLVPGERLTIENLLYGTLVHSGNDAAYALATDRGYQDFVQKMNAKAAQLGMKNSHFTNPAGLDEPGQLSSSYDLALAARALLNDPYLRKIVGTKEITISDEDFNIFHPLTNVNQLLGEIPGLGGLKTGSTELAGQNLISFYRYQGHDYIIVVMKSEDRFLDTTALVNWINDQVIYVNPELPTPVGADILQ